MKEDILEQLVDDYLQLKGYFTIHNVKFRPSQDARDYNPDQDRVYSDVDVVGFKPLLRGPSKVWVVSCKSWQAGFSPKSRVAWIEKNKVVFGREAWKRFRELAKKKWADALIERVAKLTGVKQFTYVTAVTKLKGDRTVGERHPIFRKNLRGNPIKILTLQEILKYVYPRTTTTVASSEIGRLIQVVKASGITIPSLGDDSL
jgi:hypothetical protein